jgi:hypothetical protein
MEGMNEEINSDRPNKIEGEKYRRKRDEHKGTKMYTANKNIFL